MSTGSADRRRPSETKNVLLLVDSLGLSGKTKSLVDLAIHMDRKTHVPVVASLSAAESPLAERLRTAGVRVELLGIRDGFRPDGLLRLMRLIRNTKADVVHCFNARPILLGGVAATMSGRPVLGSLSAFSCQVPDREYSYLPQPLATTNRRQIYRNRVACRLVKYLVAVSRPLGVRFFQYNGLPEQKLRTVPYGIDLAPFSQLSGERICEYRRALGVREGSLLIGSVGRLVEEKDYPTQLRAFAIALRQVPNLHMAIAGDGPLRASLEDLARTLEISDRVTFAGHSDAVALFLRALDIFVLASKFETFGVALLEAKAAGVAVIATSIHEIPEILSQGRSGRLVPAQDPEAMADAFVSLALDSSLRRTLGEHAHEEAVEKHSLEAMVRGYQQLYSEARH